MARKRKKNPVPPVLTLLIGAAVIGGGIYWWNKREDEKKKEEKEEKTKKKLAEAGCFTSLWSPATALTEEAQATLGGSVSALVENVPPDEEIPPTLQPVFAALKKNKVFIKPSEQLRIAQAAVASLDNVPGEEPGLDLAQSFNRVECPGLAVDVDLDQDQLYVQTDDEPVRKVTQAEANFILSVTSMRLVAELARSPWG